MTSQAASQLARAALWYSGKLHWLVFPCLERGKLPATKNGVLQATRDQRQVATWWSIRPQQNVAVQCGPDSGIFVLDIDQGETKDGKVKDGGAALAALEASLGPLPETVEQVTGGGGRQLFFRYPPGVLLKNSVGSQKGGLQLGLGLDTRSKGGYVVLPPSIHPSGTAYAWRPDYGPHERAFAELPPAWLERLKPKEHQPLEAIRPRYDDGSRSGRIIDRYVGKVAGAHQGERNDTLYRSSFRLASLAKSGLLHWQDAEAALLQAGLGIGLQERECSATIRSAHNGANSV